MVWESKQKTTAPRAPRGRPSGAPPPPPPRRGGGGGGGGGGPFHKLRLAERPPHPPPPYPPPQAGEGRVGATSPRKRGEVKAAWPSRSALEFLCQSVGTAAQQSDIGADRHEGAAPADVAAYFVLVAGEDAGRLADGLEAADRVLHGFLHVRMGRIAEMAGRRGKVGRADEEAVDALD